MVWKIVDRGSDHLGHVRDGRVPGGADQRGRGLVAVARPRFEDLLGRVVVGRDLAQSSLVPGEERTADPATAERGIEKARLSADQRAAGLGIPPDAAVADRPAVDLRDEQVAGRVAPFEVVVRRCERLRCLDAVVSLTSRRGGDDACEVRVVGLAAEHAEVDAGEVREIGHSAILHARGARRRCAARGGADSPLR